MAAVGAMLAFALASTGLVVPSAVADDVGEDATVIAPAEERWWEGQDITLDVSVTTDGAPGVGYVQWLEDGRTGYLQRVPLTDGRATIVVPSMYLGTGRHTIEVRHVETLTSADPQTAQFPYTSADAVEIEVAAPTVPVLSQTSWYYGDPHELRVDLTGTDEPREGVMTIAFDGGLERSAPLVGGVATFALDGTEVVAGEDLNVTHTESGSVVSSWTLLVIARSKPVTLEVAMPAGVRYGSDVVVPVRVTSPLGTPTGRVYVRREMDDVLASATVVDGRATLRFPASRLDFGEAPLVVGFNGSSEYGSTERSAPIMVRPRATSVAVSTPSTWTYGKGRRVAVTVSSPGVTPTGRVELWWDGHKLRSATLAGGKASLYVPATAVPAGWNRRLVVKYVGPSTFERKQRVWYQDVAKARPVVTFRMDRRSFPADWRDYRSVRATVTVRTAGLPERGKLCLWTRDPQSSRTRWVDCWTNWSWKVDDGWRTIRVPGVLLQGSPGKSYIKLQYLPRNPNVRSVFSNTITLRHYAP